MTEPSRSLVALRHEKKVIKSILSRTERRAYHAAWAIVRMQEHQSVNEFVCAGTRRSRMVDRMAAIIKQEMS